MPANFNLILAEESRAREQLEFKILRGKPARAAIEKVAYHSQRKDQEGDNKQSPVNHGEGASSIPSGPTEMGGNQANGSTLGSSDERPLPEGLTSEAIAAEAARQRTDEVAKYGQR